MRKHILSENFAGPMPSVSRQLTSYSLSKDGTFKVEISLSVTCCESNVLD
jgi:hypothetical protein